MFPEQLSCAVPIQRTRRQKLRNPAVLPCLAPVAAPVQPTKVVGSECPEHRGWAQSTSDIDRKPVVHLFGRVAAYLTERVLYLFGMLAGCDAICIQAVGVPVRPDVCGALVAPAADAVDRRLFPAGRPVHKSSGVCRRMASVVQHEAPELALSDVSLQVLPRPLTMAVLGPAACLLYHRNACNTAENGYAMVLLPSK